MILKDGERMKKNVVLFGASKAGENFINNQNEYQILAVADNDCKKMGKFLNGVPIISPENLHNYEYDYIVITSMYVKEIKEQLIVEFHIPENQLVVPPKSVLKLSALPFNDEITYNFATDLLLDIISLFNKNNIFYFLDFGTLLGIVRDNGIICWDDDIDLSILESETEMVLEILKGMETGTTKMEIKVVRNNKDEITNFKLLIGNSKKGIKMFEIDIFIVRFKDNLAKQLMSSVPMLYFSQNEIVKWLEVDVRVPYRYEKYLEILYGDWKIPRKNINFEEYDIGL